jgi:hypothetical protein
MNEQLFSLDSYWRQIFSDVHRVESAQIGAWRVPTTSAQFVEPRLSHVSGPEPLKSRVTIIQAPGAVGKSWYAEALAATCGLALLDLSMEGTVGANTFVGGAYQFLGPDGPGLVRAGKIGVVVDALDEAQLKVPPESFERFLTDLVDAIGLEPSIPIVLLGRTSAADDAYFTIWQAGVEPCLLSIEMFDEERGRLFVDRYFDSQSDEQIAQHRDTYKKAAHEIVQRLREIGSDAGNNDDAFAGYAPVLSAVCRRVVAEPNPFILRSPVNAATPIDVLIGVSDDILLREQKKVLENLAAVQIELPSGDDGYYSRGEQRERLWQAIYGVPYTRSTSGLDAATARAYDEAVASFFGAHPFLDAGKKPAAANVVFGADLAIRLLLLGGAATERILRNVADARNPFAFDFYVRLKGDLGAIPLEHVGLLHASLRARGREGQRIFLSVADEAGSEARRVDIRVVLSSGSDDRVSLNTNTIGNNLFLYESPVSGVMVDSDSLEVWLGNDGPLTVEAPCFIRCASLAMQGTSFSVIGPRLVGNGAAQEEASIRQVLLISKEVVIDTRLAQRRPTIASGSELLVSWPDSNVYPWTDFAVELGDETEVDIDGLRRRLRLLLMMFRSHSRGRLMKLADKIDNIRITKGDLGKRLREELLTDGVLSREGILYELHPDKLAEKLGIDYVSLRQGRTSELSDRYLVEVAKNIDA